MKKKVELFVFHTFETNLELLFKLRILAPKGLAQKLEDDAVTAYGGYGVVYYDPCKGWDWVEIASYLSRPSTQ